MKLKALFLGLAVTALSLSPAMAATPNDDVAPSLSGGFVRSLSIGHSTHSIVFLETATGTLITCGTAGFKISKPHPGHENVLKALLAAQLAREEVALAYENISGTCWVKGVIT